MVGTYQAVGAYHGGPVSMLQTYIAGITNHFVLNGRAGYISPRQPVGT